MANTSSKTKGAKMTEQQAAALVVEYLEGLGLDVYQEVSFRTYGPVADIVAVKEGREVWIVEVKTGWSLDLMEQCLEHRLFGRAHRVFAAVPENDRRFRGRLFRELGIGTIEIKERDADSCSSTQITMMAPRVTSQPLPHILGLLDEGHKTHAKAGAPCAAGRWSPWRRTCEALVEVVKKHPGIAVRAAMELIDHHYGTDKGAYSSMGTWASQGRVKGVKVVRQNRRLALYPSDYEIPTTPKRRPDPLPEWAQPTLKK